MKILLVAPAKDSSRGLAKFPPIGLGYVASALRRAGFNDVVILDCLLEGMDIAAFEAYVRRSRPDVVGINSWSLSVKDVARSLETVKRVDPSIVTVIGGPHPSALAERSLEGLPHADYGFKGEAEKGAPMLMQYLEGKAGVALGMIPGLMWKEHGAVMSNPQVFEPDLDSLGFPSWDLIALDRYASSGSLVQKKTACIITTRGCPFPCTFCSAFVTAGRVVRRRSIGNVMDEIRLLMTVYGIRRFVIFDENITLNRDHIKGFCAAVIDSGIKASFELPNGIRLDTLELDVLKMMRRAGFSERVAVGIESGSARLLRFMKKGLTKEEIKEKVDLLNAAGFRPIGYFIVGFPTETKAELEETVRFAMELRLYRAGFMPFHPLPGTESFRFLVEGGEISEDFDWSQLSTDSIAYAPKGISKAELDMLRKKAILRFNLRPRVIWDYLRDYNSFVFALRKLSSIFLKKKAASQELAGAGVG